VRAARPTWPAGQGRYRSIAGTGAASGQLRAGVGPGSQRRQPGQPGARGAGAGREEGGGALGQLDGVFADGRQPGVPARLARLAGRAPQAAWPEARLLSAELAHGGRAAQRDLRPVRDIVAVCVAVRPVCDIVGACACCVPSP
jgi:hypothetical protein